MVYQGSKTKLRKYILPILQNCIIEKLFTIGLSSNDKNQDIFLIYKGIV